MYLACRDHWLVLKSKVLSGLVTMSLTWSYKHPDAPSSSSLWTLNFALNKGNVSTLALNNELWIFLQFLVLIYLLFYNFHPYPTWLALDFFKLEHKVTGSLMTLSYSVLIDPLCQPSHLAPCHAFTLHFDPFHSCVPCILFLSSLPICLNVTPTYT